MIIPAPISTRNQFGQLLNEMGLLGKAVEVGTHRGDFAVQFLSGWHGQKLYCVDPWSNPPDYIKQARTLDGQGLNRTEDLRIAQYNLVGFGERVQLVRLLSAIALSQFEPKSLDFVYLDGNHEPPHAHNDLYGWWEKVRPGGVIAGHDFICPGEIAGGWGQYIQPVVLQFCLEKKLDLYLLVEEAGQPWSYYLIKGGNNG